MLPVAFGTVMASEAQVRAVLRTAHGELSGVLDAYTFRFTGPWAPYSFVDVHLGLRDEDELGT
ncbi:MULTISPECIES: GvpL/GvpF family gas vesicle protein [unclassified Myxococcus]|uniref:GvpL/GvpF family gas vesicle protein n=1 Tax=Myxococcus TaxID=32 RepID=UPI001EF11E2E|nr:MULTISPECIES: GvpL/GvpF family gas vesicle protein [unclassified Myxococcus]